MILAPTGSGLFSDDDRGGRADRLGTLAHAIAMAYAVYDDECL
jgi:hypothetical protein